MEDEGAQRIKEFDESASWAWLERDLPRWMELLPPHGGFHKSAEHHQWDRDREQSEEGSEDEEDEVIWEMS